MYQTKALRPDRRRELVNDMQAVWEVSIRGARRVLQAPRSTHHYRSYRDDHAELRARIKEIATTRVHYGYRRIHLLLKREGWEVNAKRVYRLYNEMGLQLRNKTPKRSVKAKLRDDRKDATHSNDIWVEPLV